MYYLRNCNLLLIFLILVAVLIGESVWATIHILSPEDNSVYLDQRDPGTNFVDKTGLLVASELNENVRTVMHFDLSDWGPDSIFQAKLYLYHYRGGYYSGSRTINVYALASGFNESTATWNFPWSVPGGDYYTGIVASADVPEEWENWVAWDVTSLLKNRWSQITDYGFLLKDPVEDTPTDGPYVRFHSHRKDSLPYLEVFTQSTDVRGTEIENLTQSFSLGQNFPNPFNSKTFFQFELPLSSRVKLTIYNICGEKIKTLLDGTNPAGSFTLEWDATNDTGGRVSSGIYLCRLEVGNSSQTKKLLYLK